MMQAGLKPGHAPHVRRSPAIFIRFVLYELRGGFLVRPMVIAIVLGLVGAVLSSMEEDYSWLNAWVPRFLFPSHADPQVAQVILAGIAASIMTVVSIVFAILLMTLTLASMQFSPRILVSFVRDHTTQWTLGLFLGTFAYCMAALPAARSLPHPFSPVATTAGAMMLAMVCVAWLIFFIQHISQAISVNHIVDRIARETELVIDESMPFARINPYRSALQNLAWQELQTPIANVVSGYIRYVDVKQLVSVAKNSGLQIRVTRKVGQFVPAGIPLLMVNRADRLEDGVAGSLRAAFDIGPTRTLQQDVEFGVLQIVDIALKAISPAVNDPSTCITCLDQLSRIMIRWVSRYMPDVLLADPPHVIRVVMPAIDLDGILDTAFEQIRHYGASDMAVSSRLLRALGDIADSTSDGEIHARLLARARRVYEGCRRHLDEADLGVLRGRLAGLEKRWGSAPNPAGGLPPDPVTWGLGGSRGDDYAEAGLRTGLLPLSDQTSV